jgi:hypothetical protein
MSNIFVKRVAKMLDGLPLNGYSESAKPIRAPVNARKVPRKDVPSEFELHCQVLHNTWGRIEFEIEPLNQSAPADPSMADALKKNETDYKVRVRTRYRMRPPSLRIDAPAQPVPDLLPQISAAQEQFKHNPDFKPNPDLIPNLPLPSAPIPPPRTPLKALSSEEARILKEKQFQAGYMPPLAPIEKQTNFSDKNAAKENTRQYKVEIDEKHQLAKQTIRKEFACRESRRMMTLISERKAQAALLQEKSVFANFALPVLETLAKSPQTPKTSLKWLAFHENANIRKAVAMNKNADLEILAILARDENESIRWAVADNPLVDKEFLLKLLSSDSGSDVQKAQNILKEMAQYSNVEQKPTPEISSNHIEESKPKELRDPNEAIYLQVIASNETTPVQRLSQLSKHDDWNVRLAVANNPHTTVRTLCLLAEDLVPLVRKQVMFNPNCPSEMAVSRKRN